jgi:hypothetical protein
MVVVWRRWKNSCLTWSITSRLVWTGLLYGYTGVTGWIALDTRQDLIILALRTLMIERFSSYFVVGAVFA